MKWAWAAWPIMLIALPFQWLAHLLGHSCPAGHEGCRWCKPVAHP